MKRPGVNDRAALITNETREQAMDVENDQGGVPPAMCDASWVDRATDVLEAVLTVVVGAGVVALAVVAVVVAVVQTIGAIW